MVTEYKLPCQPRSSLRQIRPLAVVLFPPVFPYEESKPILRCLANDTQKFINPKEENVLAATTTYSNVLIPWKDAVTKLRINEIRGAIGTERRANMFHQINEDGILFFIVAISSDDAPPSLSFFLHHWLLGHKLTYNSVLILLFTKWRGPTHTCFFFS